jgi:hypothetical protein
MTALDTLTAAMALMSAAAGPEASGAAMRRDDANWWHLCREVDRKAAARPQDRRQRDGRAPEAMVEALMYSLRRGVGELAGPDTQRRLSALSEDQLQAVCQRVQAFQSNIAEPWSADDADLLISAWGKFHGR